MDAAALQAANKAMNIFYPKQIHLTRLKHDFRRSAETIGAELPIVDILLYIAAVGNFFSESSAETSSLVLNKNTYPNLANLPPGPTITG